MLRHHDPWLVGLSLVVAIVAGYVALALAGRVTVARGGARRIWLVTGAAAMGTGIWSMHFVGMLAFRLHPAPGAPPLPMTYELPALLGSVVVAIGASAVALAVVSGERLRGVGHALASLLMGAAIAAMHYLGMAGLRVASHLHYDPPLVAASLAIAAGASFAALWLAFRLRAAEGAGGVRRRLAAALLIGVAIAGMHYTAMAAARFEGHDRAIVLHEGAVLATHGLGWAVTGTTALVLALALAGTAVDRELRARLARAQEVQRLYAEAEAARAEAVGANRRLEEQVEQARALAEALEHTGAELQRALDEAGRASRAKDEFLATMSHELRTPLNAVLGYTELLDEGLEGPVTPGQRRYLERVRASGRHLLGLINDVLNFAKLESGRVEFDLSAVHLADVVDAVVHMVEPQRHARDLTLDVRLPEAAGLPALPVSADRDKLSQVLLNLLSNAVKFTPPGGRITVEVRPADDDPELVEVHVSDTGIGIPPEAHERIFEPFVQVDRQRWTGGEQGTGLGLAISRDLARGMQGDITLRSAPGAGSTFTLRLRRATMAAAA